MQLAKASASDQEERKNERTNEEGRRRNGVCTGVEGLQFILFTLFEMPALARSRYIRRPNFRNPRTFLTWTKQNNKWAETGPEGKTKENQTTPNGVVSTTKTESSPTQRRQQPQKQPAQKQERQFGNFFCMPELRAKFDKKSAKPAASNHNRASQSRRDDGQRAPISSLQLSTTSRARVSPQSRRSLSVRKASSLSARPRPRTGSSTLSLPRPSTSRERKTSFSDLEGLSADERGRLILEKKLQEQQAAEKNRRFRQQRLKFIRSAIIKAAQEIGGINNFVGQFHEFDLNRDGSVDYEEFHALCRSKMPGLSKPEVQFIIQEIDPEQKGYLLYMRFFDFCQDQLGIQVRRMSPTAGRKEPKCLTGTAAILEANPLLTTANAHASRSSSGTDYRMCVKEAVHHLLQRKQLTVAPAVRRQRFDTWISANSGRR